MKIRSFVFHFLLTSLLLSQGDVLAWSPEGYEARLPLHDSNRDIGEVQVQIQNEELEWIDRDSLIRVLKNYLDDEALEALKELPPKVKPQELPFPLRLDVQDLKLQSSIDMKLRRSEDVNVRDDMNDMMKDALGPSPFGGAVNFRLENNWGDENLGQKGLNGQFNSFINIKTLVLENQTYYQQDNRSGSDWFRGDTRIVKDFEKNEIRTQAGDIYPQLQGFMVGRPMGGVNVQRNFSLNPYRLPFPTGTQEFTLKSRSLVKYFVNNVLVKTEYLPAGNYTAKDIPLNNGLNTILIEATDDLGVKQVFVFRSSASINLLNAGESRFDLSYGVPFTDTSSQRNYQYGEGKVFSGFYQYGLTSEFSSSLYLQNQQNFNLLGAEVIQATAIGNFSLGHAESYLSQLNGKANSASYQLVSQGRGWFQSHSLGLRYENRDDNFRSTLYDLSSIVKNNYAASYALPIANSMTFSVGVNYGDVRDNTLTDRYGFDSTLNFRVLSHHNLSIFLGRNRDEYKNWNDVAYFFLTITFPEKNDFVSALYDQQLKSTRITYLNDNQNRLHTPRTQVSLQNTELSQAGEADITYPTSIGDLGGRISAQRLTEEDRTFARGSLRVNSALVFAYQDESWGLGISRPVPGSFVILKPESRLKEQKITLKSTSPYSEAETGLFGEITFTTLLAYQYRDIQLDPTMLDDGVTLGREKYYLYPTYRSAHLITLQEKGSVVLKGRLLRTSGEPISLAVGQIGNQTFFTNREGQFFIEGLEAGQHRLRLDGEDNELIIPVTENERGMKDVGQLILEEDL